MKKLLICFAAGSLGALVNSVVSWAFGAYGITALLHVHSGSMKRLARTLASPSRLLTRQYSLG